MWCHDTLVTLRFDSRHTITEHSFHENWFSCLWFFVVVCQQIIWANALWARWMSTINSVLWLSKTDTLIVFYWMGNNVFRCCQWLVREFMGDRCWLLLIHWSGSFLRGERTNAMCHELLLLIASFFLFFDSHSVIFRWSMALALEKYLIAVQCWEYMNEWWLPFDHILQLQARDKCITDIYLIFQFIFVQETAQPS